MHHLFHLTVRGGGEVTVALDLIRRMVRALRVSSRAVEKAHGVSSAQLFVLQHLAHRPAASLTELSERTLTDPSSVSVVVSRLVRQGLVQRRVSPEDSRRILLSVTPAGRSLARRAPEPAQVRLIQGLRTLPTAQLSSLVRSLRSVTRTLGAERGLSPGRSEGSTPDELRGERVRHAHSR